MHPVLWWSPPLGPLSVSNSIYLTYHHLCNQLLMSGLYFLMYMLDNPFLFLKSLIISLMTLVQKYLDQLDLTLGYIC